MLQPKAILSPILDNPKNLDHVRSLVGDDVLYISLNHDDP
jgi:hypothetical protein